MTNQGRQSSNRLNSTVRIGNEDISLATIIIILLGVSLAFGTTWITGLFSQIGMSLVVTGLALYFAYQNRELNAIQAVMTLFTFFLMFRAVLWFMNEYVPDILTSNDMSKWAEVKSQLSSVSPLSNSPLSAYNPSYDFVVNDPTPMPVIETVTAVTQVALEPIPQATPLPPTPTPTTEDRVLELMPHLNRELAARDRVNAKNIANTILQLDPNNTYAHTIVAELAAVESTQLLRQRMPVTISGIRIDDAERVYVSDVLAGGRYRIVEDGRRGFVSACKEIATIEEILGWLKGQRYQVKRCLLDQFSVGKTGDIFDVLAQGRQ